MSQTHTYAILDVSHATYDEIARKLKAAEYWHAFDRDVIDMHGIGLRAVEEEIGPSQLEQPEPTRPPDRRRHRP